jgi:hypothetical protein
MRPALVFLGGAMPNNETVEPHLKDRVARIWAAAAARAADSLAATGGTPVGAILTNITGATQPDASVRRRSLLKH